MPYLAQLLSDLLEEGDGHLRAVVRGVLQEEGEDLQGQDLVRNLLVDHVSNETDAGGAPGLVVPLEASLEIEDEPLQEELPDVGELCVDDGGQGGVDVSEGRGGGLGLNDTLAEKTSTTDDVLRKELSYDHCNVGTVHFVNQTVDGLL